MLIKFWSHDQMASMPIPGYMAKKTLKIFFLGTSGPISMNFGM